MSPAFYSYYFYASLYSFYMFWFILSLMAFGLKALNCINLEEECFIVKKKKPHQNNAISK